MTNVVITPPAVSIPRLNGVTSNNNKSLNYSFAPESVNKAAYTAAPYATASSGLILLFGSLPLKNSLIILITYGILVEPPTRTTS